MTSMRASLCLSDSICIYYSLSMFVFLNLTSLLSGSLKEPNYLASNGLPSLLSCLIH